MLEKGVLLVIVVAIIVYRKLKHNSQVHEEWSPHYAITMLINSGL